MQTVLFFLLLLYISDSASYLERTSLPSFCCLFVCLFCFFSIFYLSVRCCVSCTETKGGLPLGQQRDVFGQRTFCLWHTVKKSKTWGAFSCVNFVNAYVTSQTLWHHHHLRHTNIACNCELAELKSFSCFVFYFVDWFLFETSLCRHEIYIRELKIILLWYHLLLISCFYGYVTK